MSNVRPSSELVAVATAPDLTIDEAERLALNAMMASFAPMDVRRRIVAHMIVPGHDRAR